MQQFNSIELIRDIEGKVEGTQFRYRLESFETNVKPSEIDLTTFSVPVVRDKELYEREKIGGIENYVANLFAK